MGGGWGWTGLAGKGGSPVLAELSGGQPVAWRGSGEEASEGPVAPAAHGCVWGDTGLHPSWPRQPPEAWER